MDEELALVDQPGVERVRRESRTADGQIAGVSRLLVADRIGVEATLEPRAGGRDDGQRGGVDDLAGRVPEVREVGPELRLGGQGRFGLPDGHRFVPRLLRLAGAATRRGRDDRDDRSGVKARSCLG
jgi:hypothetical protein